MNHTLSNILTSQISTMNYNKIIPNNLSKITLNKVKDNFDRLFDKNLTDLIRGLRNNKNNEASFIAQCIDEIKEELRIPNVNAKANAVAKLTYLQMLGYDISWAAFNIIEVMSSDRFTHKRIGYLAASQSFSNNTDVLMLTINMIRRDLCSRNMYETGCAISGLSCFISDEIARELFNDVHKLLSSTKPYLRRKAILLMFKIVSVFPETIGEVLPKLEEKLEDPDQGVQSSVINVICELARKNPNTFVHLEGTLYKLMENSSNNWTLIKIIKLFGALTSVEPRIGEKVIQSLENLAHSTSAMSVLYETISTIMAILAAAKSIPYNLSREKAYRELCLEKLRIFIEDSDQNLKYLGLLAMKKILEIDEKSVKSNQDIILSCLDDKDESIRLRALDLLSGMVSKKNLTTSTGDGIVDRLMKHVSYPKMGNKFRDEIVLKVINICSDGNRYRYIKNLDWYITVLVTLASIEGGTTHGVLIAQQLLDVTYRAEAVRGYAVRQMAAILNHTDKFASNFSVTEVLYAAAWICGEYADFLDDKTTTLFNLLCSRGFSPYIVATFIQNACKIFSHLIKELPKDQFNTICQRLTEEVLPNLYQIDDLEVQERVINFTNMVRIVQDGKLDVDFVSILYDEDSNSNKDKDKSKRPLGAEYQSKVKVPDGLDLDEKLVYDDCPLSSSEDEEEEVEKPSESEQKFVYNQENSYQDTTPESENKPSPPLEESAIYKKRAINPDIHYLKNSNSANQVREENGLYLETTNQYNQTKNSKNNDNQYEDAIEAIRLDSKNDTEIVVGKEFQGIPGLTSYNSFLNQTQDKKEPPGPKKVRKVVVKRRVVKKKENVQDNASK